MSRPYGLTATELAKLLPTIVQDLHDLPVVDLSVTQTDDDLLVFFERPGGKLVLQIAVGGPRARIVLTRTRFRSHDFKTGPRIDALRALLLGARLVQAVQPSRERRCSLVLRLVDGSRASIECELFGNRGLWCLLDAGGRIQYLSRLPDSAARNLLPGAVYAPPPGQHPTHPQNQREELEPRFDGDDLSAVDRYFSAFDQQSQADAERNALDKWLHRRRRALQAMVDGLLVQAEAAADAPRLRTEADLLLSYSHLWKKGQTTLNVPDPVTGAEMVLTTEPLRPIAQQAKARYERARRLEDAVTVHEARRDEALSRLAELDALAEGLAVADDLALSGITAKAIPLGFKPAVPPKDVAPGTAQTKKGARAKAEQEFRRYTSSEGYPILVGRNNLQNDRLSLRVARGNDLWLHVGQGHAGSHVIVRLPRGKTAGLETLLDAGTLAIHFSKARASALCDVIYTTARFVRKPKGSAPGAVTVTQEKTLRIRHQQDRLERLLDGAAKDDES